MQREVAKKLSQPSMRTVRLDQCAFLLFCIAAPLLVGCNARTTVHAGERDAQGPYKHIHIPQLLPCPHADFPDDDSKPTSDVAFNRLNRELVACPVTDGRSIEPAWSVDAWYDDSDIYPESREFHSKQETTLLFKELFQQRASASKGAPDSMLDVPLPTARLAGIPRQVRPSLLSTTPPLPMHLPARLPKIAESVTHFNYAAALAKDAAYKALLASDNAIQPASLGDTPFQGSARFMKLKFYKIVLNGQCPQYPNCEVLIALDKKIKLEVHNVHMDPQPRSQPQDEAACSQWAKDGSSASKPIPMTCFYFVVVHKDGTFRYPRDYLLLPESTALDPEHDVVYLLQGFHLMEKANEPAWKWSTFWWTPRRRDDKVSQSACKQPPATLPLACEDPWAFYSMDHQRYDALKPLAKQNPTAHYNPYIEKGSEQQKNNCIYCHARALYHKKPSPGLSDFDRALKFNTSAYMLPCFALPQSSPQSTPSLPHQEHEHGDVDCANAIPTHFLWSLANKLKDRPPQQPNEGQLLLPQAAEK